MRGDGTNDESGDSVFGGSVGDEIDKKDETLE